MKRQGHEVSRAEFERNLHDKQNDPASLDDTKPLLSAAVRYEVAEAMALVREVLIQRLPGDPWRGPIPARKPKRHRPR
jgi:hypothetical protein